MLGLINKLMVPFPYVITKLKPINNDQLKIYIQGFYFKPLSIVHLNFELEGYKGTPFRKSQYKGFRFSLLRQFLLNAKSYKKYRQQM